MQLIKRGSIHRTISGLWLLASGGLMDGGASSMCNVLPKSKLGS